MDDNLTENTNEALKIKSKHLQHIEQGLLRILSVSAHACPTKTKEEILEYIQDQSLIALGALYCHEAKGF